jgi:hypothetical protein
VRIQWNRPPPAVAPDLSYWSAHPVSSPQRPAGASPAPGSQPAGQPPGYGSPRSGPKPLWKSRPDGRTVFRLPVPLVLWWAWVAFALLNLGYIIADSATTAGLRGAALLVLVTGVMYASTVQSRVESDSDGVTIYNPLLSHRAPWGAIEGIYLGDSVEFICTRPAPRKAKTIYSWALYSRRRSRARQQLQRNIFMPNRIASMSGQAGGRRTAAEAAELSKQASSQLMATELGRRATEAREKGATGGYLHTSWSWRPLAAILGPAVFVVITLLVK